MQNAAGHLLSLGDLPLLAEGSRPSGNQLCRRAHALSGVAAYEAQA